MSLHHDELTVDESLVRRLVADRLPELAHAPVRRSDVSGSSNALFRLGDDLVARVPRQPGGSGGILKEARWAPHLAAALPVDLPEVVAVGEPGHGYPEHWSVVRWIEGVHPTTTGSGQQLARELGSVVRALRELDVPPPALADAGLRSYRGGPLAAVDEDIRDYAEQCRRLPDLDLDVDAALRLWDEAAADAGPGSDPHWLHGDLLAENLLVRDSRLAAVLDLGGLAVGDPAVDLAVAWELFEPQDRAVFRAEAGADDRSWLRGRAWALAIALMTFPYYWDTMPERCADRLTMARRALADAG